MIAQYGSHTSETIDYMEEYMTRFHEMKEIFLEFRVSELVQDTADELRRELQQARNQLNQSVAQS